MARDGGDREIDKLGHQLVRQGAWLAMLIAFIAWPALIVGALAGVAVLQVERRVERRRA